MVQEGGIRGTAPPPGHTASTEQSGRLSAVSVPLCLCTYLHCVCPLPPPTPVYGGVPSVGGDWMVIGVPGEGKITFLQCCNNSDP